jgi:hypothetical protein
MSLKRKKRKGSMNVRNADEFEELTPHQQARLDFQKELIADGWRWEKNWLVDPETPEKCITVTSLSNDLVFSAEFVQEIDVAVRYYTKAGNVSPHRSSPEFLSFLADARKYFKNLFRTAVH